ncbi:hypothetical protein ACFSL6_06760 [Paenibacillus thailandensis]|uniref:Uncharacterized protein n=1 Tax=Paenibacillus thailandensis TaxID=393250 RepID=A0ABW5R246_9BACL
MLKLAPLRVENPHSHDYRNAPVSSGLPVPPDYDLRDTNRLQLLDELGRRVPAQFLPLAWYANAASIKWVLVSFLADVPANAERLFSLQISESKDSAHPVQSLIAEASEAAGTVDTGVLRLSIGKNEGLFPMS